MSKYSAVPVLPEGLPIPCDHAPLPGNDGADENGEGDEGENVIPILDDEAHVAGSRLRLLSSVVCRLPSAEDVLSLGGDGNRRGMSVCRCCRRCVVNVKVNWR